jgi:hypothetical protein
LDRKRRHSYVHGINAFGRGMFHGCAGCTSLDLRPNTR